MAERRIDAEIQRDPERAAPLLGRCARLKQAAIEHAIVAYPIDLKSVATGVSYTPHGSMREREGATLVDRDGTLRVQIGPPAFRSAGWLASTIAHEVEVHVARQIAKGAKDGGGDEQGVSMHELEAHDFEIAAQARFGLTPRRARAPAPLPRGLLPRAALRESQARRRGRVHQMVI